MNIMWLLYFQALIFYQTILHYNVMHINYVQEGSGTETITMFVVHESTLKVMIVMHAYYSKQAFKFIFMSRA